MIDIAKIKAADPIYDDPNNSEWIIGIDTWGYVFVLKAPNIHPSFFDNGNTAEDIGLPYEMPEEKPGVYKMRCSFYKSTDWETGVVDGLDFYCEELTVLIEYA